MKTISELYDERKKYEKELSRITITGYTKPHYDYGRGEVYGESQEFKQYTDEEAARYWQSKIAEIDHIINNYEAYKKSEEKRMEVNKRLTEEAEVRYFESESVRLYESAQEEYHKKGFIGKAVALFTGKKPKKNLSEKQIQDKYLSEAKIVDIDRKIAKLISDKETIIATIRQNSGKYEYPEQLIIYYEDSFNKQIEELQAQKEELGSTRGSR